MDVCHQPVLGSSVARSLWAEELIGGLVTSAQARFRLVLILLRLGYPRCDSVVE